MVAGKIHILMLLTPLKSSKLPQSEVKLQFHQKKKKGRIPECWWRWCGIIAGISFFAINEELAKLMYRDAQDDNDDKNILSDENTLTIKYLRDHFSKVMRLWIIFGTMVLSMTILPRLNVNCEMCCHAINFISKNASWNPKNLGLVLCKTAQSWRNQNLRQILPIFSTHTHTM